jgi:hypothetical protein
LSSATEKRLQQPKSVFSNRKAGQSNLPRFGPNMPRIFNTVIARTSHPEAAVRIHRPAVAMEGLALRLRAAQGTMRRRRLAARP